MKTFYQFDPSGYLISEVLCQESPLEPGKYLIPEKCTEVIPPNFGINEIPKFNFELNIWENVKDYSKINFYSKTDGSLKKFNIEEEPTGEYTTFSPNDIVMEKWNEEKRCWELKPEKKKELLEISKKQQIETLLSKTDYIELPSFRERKGDVEYSKWMNYRQTLRNVYKNLNLEIPELPNA